MLGSPSRFLQALGRMPSSSCFSGTTGVPGRLVNVSVLSGNSRVTEKPASLV